MADEEQSIPRIPTMPTWLLAVLGLGVGGLGGVGGFTGSTYASSELEMRLRAHENAPGHSITVERAIALETRVGALEGRADRSVGAGIRQDRNLLRICQKLHVECED